MADVLIDALLQVLLVAVASSLSLAAIALEQNRRRRLAGAPHTPLNRPLFVNKNPPWPTGPGEPMTIDGLRALCADVRAEPYPFTREGGRSSFPYPEIRGARWTEGRCLNVNDPH